MKKINCDRNITQFYKKKNMHNKTILNELIFCKKLCENSCTCTGNKIHWMMKD